MARLPRLSLPGYVHQVVQRGNNLQATFLSAADNQRFLELLNDNSRRFKVAIHAYVLLGNQFSLLATPQTETGLSQFMQATGRSYVRYFNDLHHRTGTLWDGRYRSSIIEAPKFLLSRMAEMDSAPARIGLVADASAYPWSSYAHYTGLRQDTLITPHPLFWSLGNTPFSREVAYSEMVRELSSQTKENVTSAKQLTGWALGDEGFLAEIQKQTDRRVRKLHAGRPKANTVKQL